MYSFPSKIIYKNPDIASKGIESVKEFIGSKDSQKIPKNILNRSEEEHSEARELMTSCLNKVKILLVGGIPDTDTSHWTMNTAQAPQGPKIKEDARFLFKKISDKTRDKINNSKTLSLLFNPKGKHRYMGTNLIKQNLEKNFDSDEEIDAEIHIIEHPTEKELKKLVQKNQFNIIGVAIGCENAIESADKITKDMQAESYKDLAKTIEKLKKVIDKNGVESSKVNKNLRSQSK